MSSTTLVLKSTHFGGKQYSIVLAKKIFGQLLVISGCGLVSTEKDVNGILISKPGPLEISLNPGILLSASRSGRLNMWTICQLIPMSKSSVPHLLSVWHEGGWYIFSINWRTGISSTVAHYHLP